MVLEARLFILDNANGLAVPRDIEEYLFCVLTSATSALKVFLSFLVVILILPH